MLRFSPICCVCCYCGIFFVSTGISSLFEKIGCDGQLLNDMLGSEDGVKNDNVMQYLGLVEQKANELLAAQAYIDSQVGIV